MALGHCTTPLRPPNYKKNTGFPRSLTDGYAMLMSPSEGECLMFTSQSGVTFCANLFFFLLIRPTDFFWPFSLPSPISITRFYILNVNINESFSFSPDHVYMFDFAYVFIFNDF